MSEPLDLDELERLAAGAERHHWDMWSAVSWSPTEANHWQLDPYVTEAARDLAVALSPEVVSELVRRARLAPALPPHPGWT